VRPKVSSSEGRNSERRSRARSLLPGANRGDGLLRITEAELFQRGERGGIALVAWQHDAWGGFRQRRQLFEERAVVRFDRGKLSEKSVGEGVGEGKAG
jgi:hypothetical protein